MSFLRGHLVRLENSLILQKEEYRLIASLQSNLLKLPANLRWIMIGRDLYSSSF